MRKLQNSRHFRILLALLLFATPLAMLPSEVDAVALSSMNDTLEESRPSTDANHLIQFVTATGIDATGETITLTFDDAGDAFDLTDVAFGDIDLAVDDDGVCDGTWTDKTLAATAAAATWGVNVNTGTDVITLTAPTDATTGEITAGYCVQIEIGDNATGGANLITNPASAGVYIVDVYVEAGAVDDQGAALVVVVDTITASVTVDETLTFTVAAVTSASCLFDGAAADVTTTATTIPFGTTTGDAFIDGCQDLTVSTNASDGYSVTVQASELLTSGGDTIAEGTCDGACADTTFGTWNTATNNGFGYCVTNGTGNPFSGQAAVECQDAAAVIEFKTFRLLNGSETPEQIMSETTSVAGDQLDIGFRLSVPSSQVAGTYTNNIIYVATPTY